MDAHQPGRPGSGVGKPVRHPGRADHDVARSAVEGLAPDADLDATLQDDKGLVVGMMMQPGGPWPGWLCTRKNDTEHGPCLPPSKVRETPLPGRSPAFT